MMYYGLDWFSQYFLVVIQFVQQVILVQFQFVDFFEGGLIGDQCIVDVYVEVMQNGGVGQVVLLVGNWQFVGQVLYDCIGQVEIVFGVFEVNWVYFVWYGGGVDFFGDGFLFEVVECDVVLYVVIEVDQNGVEVCDVVKQFSDIVMWFDLCGVWVLLNIQ